MRSRRTIEDDVASGGDVEVLEVENEDGSNAVERLRLQIPGGFTPALCFHRMRSSCSSGVQLCCASECPAWMRRPYIEQGYRPDLSGAQCAASCFRLHNETGNIWTHALGCAWAGGLAWRGGGAAADRPFSPHLVPYENAVLRAFLLAAAGCLLLSACYHAGNCSRDEAHCSALLRLDASGVAVLIAASFLPGVYYGFACFPELRRTYLCVTGALLVVGLAVSLADSCTSAPGASLAIAAKEPLSAAEPAAANDTAGTAVAADTTAAPAGASPSPPSLVQRLRTFTFASFVALGLAGALQWRFLVKAEARALFFPKVAGSLAFYGLGFGFYASRWPERRWPGAFDYALHSHQLWHACVVAAVGVWYGLCVATTTALGAEGCAAFVRVAAASPAGTASNSGDGGVPFGLRASHAR